MTCKTCGSGAPPYYELVHKDVLESHELVLNEKCYAAGVIVPESWNVPGTDEDIAIPLQDVTNIAVGAYLHNPYYGYFKITQWNPQKGQVGVRNEKIPGTAAPGTYVPANTLFVVTPKPCCQDNTSTLFPFVAEDFIAPDVNQSLIIQVTSTFGLRLGGVIRIGTGVYRLDLISSSKQITIFNQGAGITPGTEVKALDADGNFQYLIVAETVTACSSPSSEEGRLVVCDGANEKILSGDFTHQVPVLVDPSTSLVQFKILDTDVRTCSKLTADVNISVGTLTYTIKVEDTTGFYTGAIIQLNFGSTRFTVDAVPDATTLNISTGLATIPSDITVVRGSYVCQILTSEFLLSQFSQSGTGLQGQITALSQALAQEVTVDRPAAIQSAVQAEATIRANADTALSLALSNEVGARQTADTTLGNAISNEATIRSNADIALGNAISDEVTNRTDAVQAEADIRAGADSTLTTNLNSAVGWLNGMRHVVQRLASAAMSPTTLSTVPSLITGNPVETVIQNDGTRNMTIHVTSETTHGWRGSNTAGTDDMANVVVESLSEIQTGPIGTTSFSAYQAGVGFGETTIIRASKDTYGGAAIPHSRGVIIGPGQEARIRVIGRLTFSARGSANTVIGSINIASLMTVMGVAI